MNITDLQSINLESEETLGTEDRLFRADGAWYWQARGSSDIYGPFVTRGAAVSDYVSSQEFMRHELLRRGCEHLRAADRSGITRTGWWRDGVYLGPDSDLRDCLLSLLG